MDATARAQAAQALDEAARALKRTMSTSRTALHAVRQAQVNLIGITVTTVETTQGSGDRSEHTGTCTDS